jgi:hypothetical protein
MSLGIRAVDSLTEADLRASPVWEFVSNDEPDETSVRPVEQLPISTLDGRVIGIEAKLANGRRTWMLLGNIDLNSASKTSHFLTLSLWVRGGWFNLARYHDFGYDTRGPAALALTLGLAVSDVFPIRYDISAWALGSPETIRGIVEAEPRDRLSRAELIALAVS